MFKENIDILIIGGGLVGLSLAKGLEDRGISYLLVDAPMPESAQKIVRALALSKSTIAILKHLKVWSKIKSKVTPIHHIHVSCEGAMGTMNLVDDAHEFLGVVIDLDILHQALKQSLSQTEALQYGQFKTYDAASKTVNVLIGDEMHQLHPKIIIAADGANSSVRQACQMPIEEYPEQVGFLAQMTFENPHHGKAFERFTRLGPLALLPWNTHQMAMVWGMKPSQAEIFKYKTPHEIQAILMSHFEGQLGNITAVEGWSCYPLKQMFMPRQSFHNILFLGNAAHTLHPVAGQGFNLSLRDVASFLDVLDKFGFGVDVFPVYGAMRYEDQRFTQWITSFLAQDLQKIPKFLQGLGLGILNQQQGFKKILGRYAQGFGYVLPDWVYEEMGDIND